MELNPGFFIGLFIGLLIMYCLYLSVIGLFKSNPGDYVKIIKLENKFKNKEFDSINKKGETLLLQAIQLGAETLALDIIKSKKVDIFKPSNDGGTAFFFAVICDNLKIVKALVKAGEQIEPKKCGKFGHPLLWASRAGSINLIDYFLNKGANLNRQTTKKKYTALMGAAFTLKEKAIIHLIEKGADKKIKTKDKQIALDIYKNSSGKNKSILHLLK